MQNLRRGHYELGIEALPGLTVPACLRRTRTRDLNRQSWPRLSTPARPTIPKCNSAVLTSVGTEVQRPLKGNTLNESEPGPR